MDLWQLLKRRLDFQDVLFGRRLHLRLTADSRVQLPELLPTLIHAQRRVELQSPEPDGTGKDRRVILDEDVFRNILLRRDGVESLPEMVDSRERDFVDPSLSPLSIIRELRVSIFETFEKNNEDRRKDIFLLGRPVR